ncbi:MULTISPECIES: PEP-CTERM sorting domain-containing protein [unclassified Microcoleus]|uniref:PEP-CTERM sorting domain-containing protein n=1 Tax=unclassified Microcoleus TaxID=2642155 RepID=UPI002FD1367D
MKEKNLLPVNIKIKVSTMKSQFNLVKSILAVAGIAAVSAVSAAPASAIGLAPASAFSFANIVGGDTPGDAYANSFSFNVIDEGTSVLFNIINSGNAAASEMFISKVFFDDNNFLSGVANIYNNSNVAFSGGASNDRLPQGGNGFTTDYAFSRNTGAGNRWGIQGGETLGVSFTGNYKNVVSALNTGALKLGLHVQALPQGQSDAYLSTISTSNTEATPEPLTMLAAAAAVGFGAKFKKQRAQAQKAE